MIDGNLGQNSAWSHTERRGIMAKYIAKRIGLAIVTCWLVATLTFFLMNLVPGGPFMAEKALTPQALSLIHIYFIVDKF